jgi:hypothetical protein
MNKSSLSNIWLQRLAIVIMTLLVLPFSGCRAGDAGTTTAPANQNSGSVDAVPPVSPVKQNDIVATAGIADIPVNLKDAGNVGGLSFDLVYDPAVLEVTAVKAGTLAQNALIDSNTKTPGHLIIGIVSSSSINGSGAVANVTFKSKATTGTSTLTLEKVEAYSADKLQDIRTQVSAGQFNAKDSSSIAPSISF